VRRRLLAAVVAGFLAAGAACGGTPSKPPPAGERVPSDGSPLRLRIVSYNVNFGLGGDTAGVRAVADLDPDLVLLQESNDAWAAAFTAGLGGELPHHRFTPPPDMPAGGMGVLSRWPILAVDQLAPPEDGLFFAWRVVIDAPGGPFQVLNLHLRPPISKGGSWVVGYFSTGGIREREAAVHAEALDPALPALVTGDFNEERGGPAIDLFERRGFTDVLAAFAPDRRTWEWPVGGITLRMQLDHLMYDAGWLAAGAGVADAGRSDHRPVWADLERAPAP